MPRALRLIPVPLVLALLLGGCSGGSPVPVRNRTIGLKLDEYRIIPQNVTAPAGRLRIIVRNRGRLTHNIVVQTIPKDPNDQPKVLGRTPTVHPGQRAETHIFLRPGKYQLACTIGNHNVLGQTGTLIVK